MHKIDMAIDPRLRYDVEEEGTEDEECYSDSEGRLGFNPQVTESQWDAQLEHDRKAKKQKLQSRFEHIFAKYGRDFEGIGDEIDLETGLIVVDNGHLKSMRHEVDPGDDASAGLRQTVGEDSEHEQHVDHQDSGSEGGSEDGFDEDIDDDSDDEGGALGKANNELICGQDQAADSKPALLEADHSVHNSGQGSSPAKASPHLSTENIFSGDEYRTAEDQSLFGNSDFEDVQSTTPPANILDQIPSLKASMLDLQSKHRNGQRMDQNDIDALGMSIATELTDFMGLYHAPTSGTKRKRAGDPVWSYPELPSEHLKEPQTQSRRLRSPSPIPEYIGPSPGQKSLWAPLRVPKPRKKRKLPGEDQLAEVPAQGQNNVLDHGEGNDHLPPAILETGGGHRKCCNCECSSSLIWRSGPDGILCNACGMYYYRYGLIRPLGPPPESDDSESSDDSDAQVDDAAMKYTANTSRPRRGGKAKTTTPVEVDAMLIKLKEIDRFSWERIAKFFPGRTAYGLQCRYSKKLHLRPVEARAFLVNQGYEFRHDENEIITFTPVPQPSKIWTEEEDDLLLKLREGDGLEWEQIAASFPGRTGRAMERRFKQLARRYLKGGSHTIKPKTKKRSKGPRFRQRYSSQEDENIVKLREIDKLSWAQVAEKVDGRNALALQKRYVRGLVDKSKGLGIDELAEGDGFVFRSNPLKHSRYMPEEDQMLLHLRDDLGLDWHEVEERMPGRKRASLENRYQYIPKSATRKAEDAGIVKAAAGESDAQQNLTRVVDGAQSEDELMQDTEELTSMPSFADTVMKSDRPTSSEAPPSDGVSGVQEHTQDTTASNVLPAPDKEFTATDDALIIRLREHENLAWEKIAVQLSNRRVSSIIDRYQHTLRPNAPPRIQRQEKFSREPSGNADQDDSVDQAGDVVKRRKRWTQDELDTVANYREQGRSWSEISTQMPWRSAPAISIFYNAQKKLAKRTTMAIAEPSERSLLRHAVGNNMRRHSEPGVAPENAGTALVDLSARNLDEKGSEGAVHDSSTQVRTTLLPSALPRYPSSRAGDIEDGSGQPSRQAHNHVQHAHDMPALQPPEFQNSPLSRYIVGALQGPWRSDADTVHASPTLETPYHPAQDILPSSQPTMGHATTKYFTPMRYNHQSHPYYIVPPVHTLRPPPEEHIPAIEAPVAAQVDEVPSPLPLRRSQRKRTRTAKTSPAKVDTGFTRKTTARKRNLKLTTLKPTPMNTSLSEDKIVAYKETTDNGGPPTEDKFVSEGHASDGEESNYKKEPSDHGLVAGLDRPVHEVVENAPSPPPYSWADLAIMALKSDGTKPMRVDEMVEYLESRFPYFKTTSPEWKARIQTDLSRKPYFVKAKIERETVWALKDAEQQLLGVHKKGQHPAGYQRRGPGRPRKATKSVNADTHVDELNVVSNAGKSSDGQSEVTQKQVKQEIEPASGHIMRLRSSTRQAAAVSETISNIGAAPLCSSSLVPRSDPDRGPASSPGTSKAHDSFMDAVDSFQTSMSDISKISQAMLSSSSPFLTTKTPGNVYNKADTPNTERSTLFGRPHHRGVLALRASFRGRSAGSRSNSVAPGSVKRIVYTPVRDVEGSEDELA